jgi:hypothetical protein
VTFYEPPHQVGRDRHCLTLKSQRTWEQWQQQTAATALSLRALDGPLSTL